jgi:arylsulfatase A-like enzyme
VHVPLIVAGKHVPQQGRTCDALINTVDLFPTIAELMGVDMRAGIGDNRTIDGVSMLPYLADPSLGALRTTVFADKFSPNGFGPYASQGWMLRDARWKLIRRTGQADQFFDIGSQYLEGPELVAQGLSPEQQAAYDALAAQLDALLISP